MNSLFFKTYLCSVTLRIIHLLFVGLLSLQTGEMMQSIKQFLGLTELKAPGVLLIDVQEQKKYSRNSASKEDIQEIVDSFKASTLAMSPLR